MYYYLIIRENSFHVFLTETYINSTIRRIMENNLKLWVKAWEKASLAIEEINRAKAGSSNPNHAIESLNLIFKAVIRRNPPSAYTGLIEQQRYFARLMR